MTKCPVIFALAVMTFAVAPQALKAARGEPLCQLGNETIRGAYIVMGGGTIVGVGPIASVGVMTFDGNRNGALTLTASANGAISRGIMLTGPYTLNSDCIGSLVLSNGSHYDFVAASDGTRVNFIETDHGVVFSGTSIRLTGRREEEEFQK